MSAHTIGGIVFAVVFGGLIRISSARMQRIAEQLRR